MDNAQTQSLFAVATEHHRANRLTEARAGYEKILVLDPAHADALHLLGVVLHQSGQDSDKAIELVRRAIALNPSAPEYHANLGLIYSDRRQWKEAAGAFGQSVALRPRFAPVLNYLGNALREMGQLEAAVAAYRRAVEAKSDFFVAFNNLGNVLRELNRPREAADACRRAIALKPDFAAAHNNLGNALNKQDRVEEAIAEYRMALSLDPQYAESRSNLGNALKDVGRLDEAIAAYREALALNPNLAKCHANLLYDLHYRDEFDPLETLAESRRWAGRFADPLSSHVRAHTNQRDPDRRLKIGYVSADFCQHSVGSFLLPLLKCHDHQRFEIICYSNLRAPDRITAIMRQTADAWRDILGMPDDRAAELIRQDGIDILVDLGGHTAQSRLPLFALRPAPIQMTYLGYPGTTGVAAIDYRLTDALADPPGMTESHFSETLLRLPRSNWCYAPLVDAPPVGPVPSLAAAEQNQSPRPVCFGSLNNFAKVSKATFQSWATLLCAIPNSRLLLKAKALAGESVRREVVGRFADLGVAPGRLDLRGRLLNPIEHLATYGEIDIALDTFPYHGTTTTCEALWMGVPVVTLAGKSHVCRVGVSLLSSVGLADLIAQTPEQYIEIAARLASDLPRLSEIRAGLRARMSASPLMDAPSFARDVEAAYRAVWKKWCADESGTNPPVTAPR
jgi:predicted O-linked N-acetylglucosamine transferase (SPINDLY family)